MYLTYNDYVIMGGTLSEATFNDLEYEARMYVDWVTYNRLHGEEDIPDAVKECMYHIIKIIKNKLDSMNIAAGDGSESEIGFSAAVASQSNDGVSVSYNVLSAKDVIESSNKELEDAMNRYLQGIRNSLGHRLLFKGLYPGEEVK